MRVSSVVLQNLTQVCERILTIGTQLKIVSTVKATMIGAHGKFHFHFHFRCRSENLISKCQRPLATNQMMPPTSKTKKSKILLAMVRRALVLACLPEFCLCMTCALQKRGWKDEIGWMKIENYFLKSVIFRIENAFMKSWNSMLYLRLILFSCSLRLHLQMLLHSTDAWNIWVFRNCYALSLSRWSLSLFSQFRPTQIFNFLNVDHSKSKRKNSGVHYSQTFILSYLQHVYWNLEWSVCFFKIQHLVKKLPFLRPCYLK